MSESLLAVTPASLAYLLIGGFIVLFSLVSLLIKERLYIGEVVVGTVFGIIIGPYCANIFDPRAWGGDYNKITLEVMRIVLATGLFAVGVELPKAYLKNHARSLSIMVIPTMAFGWVLGAGFLHLLVPGLSYISCLAISACLTPTDPILASAIVGGKFAVQNVPAHIRHLISAESAANDGLAYPFLSLSIYLTLETSRAVAFKKFLLIGWLYEVVLGTLLGAFIGWAFSHLLKFSHRKGLIDRDSIVAQYLALAIFTAGVAASLGLDDLLAAFAAGSAVSWDGEFKEHTEGESFATIIDLLLNIAAFIYIGAWMPFDQFNSPELGVVPWKLVVFFFILLFLRRIPFVMLMYKWIPDIKNWREAFICAHFGPIGVSAVFVSTLAISELPTPSSPPANQEQLLAATLQPIVAFVVLGSVFVHGLSIPAFWFGRKWGERTLSRTTTWSMRGNESMRDPEKLITGSTAVSMVGSTMTGPTARPSYSHTATITGSVENMETEPKSFPGSSDPSTHGSFVNSHSPTSSSVGHGNLTLPRDADAKSYRPSRLSHEAQR